MSQNFTLELPPLLEKFPRNHREYLIPVLQEVQAKLAYLPPESIDAVAAHLGITAAKVYGVATFYNQFRLVAPGRCRIAVCRGTACHVIGSATLLQALESELGIKAGQTTRDGAFSIETVACIGACSMAPAIVVGERVHGRLTAKSLARLIKELKQSTEVKP
jgi:NADH-quinone oxidoreductase subunit E